MAVIVDQTVSRLDCEKKTPPVSVFTPYRTQDRIRDPSIGRKGVEFLDGWVD